MNGNILIADDDASIRRLLSRALAAGGHGVLGVGNGDDALATARRERPDLILLDRRMPGASGLEVLAELRKDSQTRLIPVILVSGDGAPDDMAQGLEAGADDYVAKPFDLEELAARVDSVLRRNRRNVAANPLTRLPGGPAVEEEAQRREAAGEPFALVYADIDRFKDLNDSRGPVLGDELIRLAAEALVREARAHAGPTAYVGHIGGDDFVALCPPERAEALAAGLAAAFDGLARGLLAGPGPRADEPCSVSIAVVSARGGKPAEYVRLVEEAVALKAFLKSLPSGGGSRYGVSLCPAGGPPSPGSGQPGPGSGPPSVK